MLHEIIEIFKAHPLIRTKSELIGAEARSDFSLFGYAEK